MQRPSLHTTVLPHLLPWILVLVTIPPSFMHFDTSIDIIWLHWFLSLFLSNTTFLGNPHVWTNELSDVSSFQNSHSNNIFITDDDLFTFACLCFTCILIGSRLKIIITRCYCQAQLKTCCHFHFNEVWPESVQNPVCSSPLRGEQG